MVLNCAGETRKRDVTTMFTYSHANTPLGQSERAYYLSYFITIFINWESGSTICMNFILRAPENQTRLVLLFKSEFFGENTDVWPTLSSVVTMAMINLLIQIWLFLFIPPGNLPPHKN